MLSVATKKDYLLVTIIGALFGLFSIPILENIRPSFWHLNFFNAAALTFGFMIFANFALAIAGLLGKKLPALWQFAKYGASGALSSALDIGVLNLLSFIFQVFSGSLILVFNTFSIFLATTNSYLWNKLWAFKKDGSNIFNPKEYFKFMGVTLGSLVIGAVTVYILTTFVQPPAAITKQLWENIAKAISIPIVVTWNFIFYKFVVFK